MKLIKPSVTLIKETDPFKKIEMCGRLCYKSELKGDPENFYSGLVKRNHFAMLEHATFVFEVSKHIYCLARTVKYLNATLTQLSDGSHRYLVSGNLRVFNESNFVPILVELKKINPLLAYSKFNFSDAYKYLLAYDCDGKDMLVKIVPDLFCLEELTEKEFMAHAYFSFHFICDRGVTHEIVRHRPASYAQESTRYCNYSNDKFGSEITCIEPAGYDEWEDYPKKQLNFALNSCEDCYKRMIDWGMTPQQARAVLPNALKTEIIMTASAGEFEHFFDLRSRGITGAPHPDMKVVADMALNLYEETADKFLK